MILTFLLRYLYWASYPLLHWLDRTQKSWWLFQKIPGWCKKKYIISDSFLTWHHHPHKFLKTKTSNQEPWQTHHLLQNTYGNNSCGRQGDKHVPPFCFSRPSFILTEREYKGWYVTLTNRTSCRIAGRYLCSPSTMFQVLVSRHVKPCKTKVIWLCYAATIMGHPTSRVSTSAVAEVINAGVKKNCCVAFTCHKRWNCIRTRDLRR